MQRDDHIFILIFLISFLFLSMILCAAIGVFFPVWLKISLFIFVGIIVCLYLILFQLLAAKKERKRQLLAKVTIKDLIGLPFGAFNTDAEVSKWIKIPSLSILFLLTCLLVFIIVAALIANLITHFTS